jgi:uncharacterized protein (DUF58 family)
MKGWLSEDFIRRLEQLTFFSKRLFYGGMKGDALSRRQGSSVEFADYRRYQPGDDIRYIDWSLYARLDKLLVKLFQDETNIYIYILVDKSLSMDFGVPTKLKYGLKVAAALSYIGISNMEQVGISLFSSQLEQQVPPSRGKTQIMYLFEFLSNITPGGQTNLNQSLQMFAASAPQPGIAIIISDFWDGKGYEAGLRYLLQKRFEVSLIQLFTPEEYTPTQTGPLVIKDVEGREQINLNVNQRMLKRYHRLMTDYNRQLADFCQTYNITYLPTLTRLPFEELVLRYMRIRGG